MTTQETNKTYRPRNFVDRTGQQVGKFTIIGFAEDASQKQQKQVWLAQCECKNRVLKTMKELNKVTFCSKQCPLLHEHQSKVMGSHNMSRHPAFAVWASMKARCLRKTHHAYHNYGGRGIKVCERWLESFENFWEDMRATYKKGLTLDRADNDGDYCVENCRWATWKEQARNTRHSRIPGWALDLAAKNGVKPSTLQYRVSHGLSFKKAATLPVNCGQTYAPKTKALITRFGLTEQQIAHAVSLGVSEKNLRVRLVDGWTLEEAWTTPPISSVGTKAGSFKKTRLGKMGAPLNIWKLVESAGITKQTFYQRLLKGVPWEMALKYTHDQWRSLTSSTAGRVTDLPSASPEQNAA
jgi:hypothetical protein